MFPKTVSEDISRMESICSVFECAPCVRLKFSNFESNSCNERRLTSIFSNETGLIASTFQFQFINKNYYDNHKNYLGSIKHA